MAAHLSPICFLPSPPTPPSSVVPDLRSLLLLPLISLFSATHDHQKTQPRQQHGSFRQYRLTRSFTVATEPVDAGIRCIHSPQRILRHLGDFSLIPNSTTRPVRVVAGNRARPGAAHSVIMSFGIAGGITGDSGTASAACWSARIMSDRRRESALFLMDNTTLMPVALARLRVDTAELSGAGAGGYTVSVDAIFFDAGVLVGAWLALNWLGFLHGVAGGRRWGGGWRVTYNKNKDRRPSSIDRVDRMLHRRYERMAGTARWDEMER